jgi:hypothetical protein
VELVTNAHKLLIKMVSDESRLMSGHKKTDPSATDVANAQEYAGSSTETTYDAFGFPDGEKPMTAQDWLVGTTRPIPGRRPTSRPTSPLIRMTSSRPRRAKTDQQGRAQNPALLSIEPFENWTFTQIYEAMHSASNTPTSPGHMAISVMPGEVNRQISENRNTRRCDQP